MAKNSSDVSVTFWGPRAPSPARCTWSRPAGRRSCSIAGCSRAGATSRGSTTGFSLLAQRHRHRRPQPRPHRSLRQPAPPRAARLSRSDLLHAGDARPWPPSCSPTPPRSRKKTPPISIAIAAERSDDSAAVRRARCPSHHAAGAQASRIRRCRTSARMSTSPSSTPATCSARRWCTSNSATSRSPSPAIWAARDADPARSRAGPAGRPPDQ